MGATFLYKAAGDRGKQGLFLAPSEGTRSPPIATLPNGQTITGRYINTNEGRHQFSFGNDLFGVKDVKISYGGQTTTLADPTLSYEGSSLSNWTYRAKGDLAGGGGDGAVGADGLPSTEGITFDPVTYKPINYTPINYKPIKAAPNTFVDPIASAGKYNTFNTAAEQKAYETGKSRATELTNLDTAATTDFANQMSGLQTKLVGAENKFNQQQRLNAVDFAMPDLRPALKGKFDRASTYASGRLLGSAEDRAYEVAARSASADGSFTRGFGDDSVFGKRTSDILSAQQRLGISQMGEGLLNDWISQGSSLLIDSPLKTSISQRLPSTPQILPSQQAGQQQTALTNLTTVPLQFGISSEINQEQFRTNLEQSTRTFNASNELGKDQFNASNTLNKDQFNASNDLQSQEFNSSGKLQAATAKVAADQGNAQIATAASNRADDIARADAHNEAASTAASQNIDAQHSAGNAGAVGTVVGGIISAGVSAVTGGLIPLSQSTPIQPTGPQSLQAITGGQPQAVTPVMQGNQPFQGSAAAPIQQGSGGVPIETPQVSARSGSLGGQVLPSGAPTSYQGSPIPVSGASTDHGATAGDISSGYQALGGAVNSIGQSGPSTPQMTNLGKALQTGGSAAQNITQGFDNVSTPQAKMMLTDQLHGAASANAPTSETKATVDQIFSQVREHLDTGVGVNGQAAGIAGFVQNYNDYSGPEKARAITNISFAGQDLHANYGVKDLTADSIGNMSIPGTRGMMKMQDALSLANSGYNVSSLVNNWDDIHEVHSALNDGGNNNLLSVAATARNLGLLSTDSPKTISDRQQSLKAAGGQPAGAWGIGAVTLPSSKQGVAEGLGMIVTGKTKDGQIIAVPAASLASTGITQGIIGKGAIGPGAKDITPSTLAVGQGASSVYNSWGTNFIPKQQMAMGESAPVANGLYKAGNSDPYLLGSIVVGGLTGQWFTPTKGGGGSSSPQASGSSPQPAAGGNMAAIGATAAAPLAAAAMANPGIAKNVGVGAAVTNPTIGGFAAPAALGSMASGMFGGKSSDQKGRDVLRARAQNLGLADSNFDVTLASGQKFNIGVDGHGGQRDWHNPDARRPDQTGVSKLHAYDVDYTKDLDGVMNVSGTALSALMYGSMDDNTIRQMGNQFTNAAVSDAGTADLTSKGFATSQSNMQGFFKKAGIETKQEAYALSNQMVHEGRISQVQAVQIQQGINLAFDLNGFQAANQLLEGVKLGRKGGESKPSTPTQPTVKPTAPTVKPKATDNTAPDLKMPNIIPYAQTAKTSMAKAPDLTNPMEIQT